MTRILHNIGSLHIGGSQTFIMSIYRNIDRTRVQFDFVVSPETEEGFYNEIKQLGGRIFVCPRYNGKNHFEYCKWWEGFLKEHREYRIIHGHVRSTAAIYLWIAKKLGRVTIAHSHSTSNGKGVSAFIKDVMQLPIRYIADYMFACSDEAGKYLFGKKSLKKNNYRMIPNAIDCERFRFDPEKREVMRRELGLENCYVIGHVGRLSEPKNHTFLLDVFAEVEKEKPEARLLLVGDGPLRESLQKKCNDLGIAEKVLFVGAKLNTEDYYQAMDVFAFPSLWEGLPVSVVEAQASGLSCLISDAITRNVDLTDLVSYLPIGDSRIWISAIDDAKLFKRCGISDKNRILLNPFNSTVVIEELESFYSGKSKEREE